MVSISLPLILASLLAAIIASLVYYFQHTQITQSTKPLRAIREGRVVTLEYDEDGIGRIEGETLADVMYAQGYQHAQQRMFQMDMMRRLIEGRLSEVVGEKALQIDKYFRTLGPHRKIKAQLGLVNKQLRTVLEAYAAGVNDYAFRDMQMHPLEYHILRFRFEAWEIADSLAIAKLLQYGLSFDFQFELLRESLARVAGWTVADALLPAAEEDYVWGKEAYILSDQDLKQSGLYVQNYHESDKTKKGQGENDQSGSSKDTRNASSQKPKQSSKEELKQKRQQQASKKPTTDAKETKKDTPSSKSKEGQQTKDKSNKSDAKSKKSEEKQKPKTKETVKGNEKKQSKGTKQKKARESSDDGSEFAQTVQGSNCWAVHGNHTASGYPIVAGDPHLNTGVPTIWVFSGIQVKDEFSFGSSVPGVAGIFFGRSKRHTWAITSMGADIGDVFEERIQGNKYNYEGKWHPLKIIEEVIKIKGQKPHKLKVKETRHGPLINDVVGIMHATISYAGIVHLDKDKFYSMQWEGNEFPIQKLDLGFQFIDDSTKVTSGMELVKQIRENYRGMTMSMCFATSNGDIGYMGAVNLPIREPLNSGSKVKKGWLKENDWKGYIPHEAMPFVVNPAKGFVACSNQRIASDHLNYRVSGNGYPMARAVTQTRIIKNYISKGIKITPEHMMKLQNNLYDSYAADALPLMLKIAEPHLQTEAQVGLIKLLKNWDFNSPVGSVGASIYYSWESQFLLNILGDWEFENGRRERADLFIAFQWEQWFMKGLRAWSEGKDYTAEICGLQVKMLTPKLGHCGSLLVKSFKDAVVDLTQKFGEDVNLWIWGNLHRQQFKHPLSGSPLKPFFHKSFAAPGSRRTLNVALYYSVAESTFDSLHAPNQRVVVQLGPNDQNSKEAPPSYWNMDMGNSGIKGSVHYDNFMEDYRDGEYNKMKFGKE